MTDTAIAPLDDMGVVAGIDEAALLERVVIVGDLAKLKPEHRVIYYRNVCQSLGLNPLTRPFQYIVLNGKLTLYATRTATDQLRSNHGISIDSIEHAEVGELYIATVHGHDRRGRRDSEVGAVNIANLRGDNRANAIMKAITKAKRRLTLSLAGLGWLDDSEVGSMPEASQVDVDPDTGAIAEPPKSLADLAGSKLAEIADDVLEAEVVETTSGPVHGGNGTEQGGEASPPSSDEPPRPADQAGARAPRRDSGRGVSTSRPAPDEGGTADIDPARHPLQAGPRADNPVASDEPVEDGRNQGGDAGQAGASVVKSTSPTTPADPARPLCGALPPEDGLGMSLPCEVRADAGHRTHKSPEGTWPNKEYAG